MKRLTVELTYFLNRLLFGLICVPGILWAVYSLLAEHFMPLAPGQLIEFYAQFYQHLDSPMNLFWVLSPYLVFLLVRPHARTTAARTQENLRNAARKGREQKVKQLLDEGAGSQAANDTGNTPLQLAATTDNANVVRMLVQSGAEVDAIDPATGLRPLHNAAIKGSARVCECLLRYGADMDAQTPDGNTALHLAAQHNHYDTVDLLLNFHANHTLSNTNGQTAEQLASSKRNTRIATLIQQHAGNEWLYPRMARNRSV